MRRALAFLACDDDASSPPSYGDAEGADYDEKHEEPRNVDSMPSSSFSAAASSIVTALAAAELRRETALWERMVYKSASQHRRAVHFQRMRGVTRHLRALGMIDVGSAARALRDGLRAGIGEDARAAALASPAVAAGAHAIWKLPPRALWEDLACRLCAAGRVAAEADDALIAAALALSGQLAHTYFMPFALVATACVARLRAALHQLAVDVVSSYNVLAPLLNGGVMPPPALVTPQNWGRDEQSQMPESLRCEWSPVTAWPPLSRAAVVAGATTTAAVAANAAMGVSRVSGSTTKEKQSTPALRPNVCTVQASFLALGMIDDEDWHWRLLHQVMEPVGVGLGIGMGYGSGTGAGARANTGAEAGRTGAKGGVGREDLGAAIPRNVRGLTAQLDRGGSGGGSSDSNGVDFGSGSPNGHKGGHAAAAPSYSRVAFGLGLGGLGTSSKPKTKSTAAPAATAATAGASIDELTQKPKSAAQKHWNAALSPVSTPSLAKAPARAPARFPVMDLASLTYAVKPQATADILQPKSSGKKRRRPGALSSSTGGTAETPVLESAGEVALSKKKKKRIKQGGSDDTRGGSEVSKLGSSGDSGKLQAARAIDRAMALLLGKGGTPRHKL